MNFFFGQDSRTNLVHNSLKTMLEFIYVPDAVVIGFTFDF